MNDSLIIENFSVYINKKNRTELVIIAKKFQKYHNIIQPIKDTQNLDAFDEAQSKLYINKKIEENNQLRGNLINIARLIYDETETLYYDYYETFINRQRDETFQLIYDNMNSIINNTNDMNDISIDEMKKKIVEMAKHTPEFQDVDFFDKSIDVFESAEPKLNDTITFFKNKTRNSLVKYCLAIEVHLNGIYNERISPIINVASKNELVRYIIRTYLLYPNYILIDKLDLLIKTYYLDYGEESIIEISEY